MLYKCKSLIGLALHGRDGDIGAVKEFYFDDLHWTVRYLVADTGDWLSGRQVLLSPYALGVVEAGKRRLSVNLTKKQIENSPPLDNAKPLSRHFEEAYHEYYAWPSYYGGPYMWGGYSTIERSRGGTVKREPDGKTWDSHLRSTREVGGYYVGASDGDIGHVEDFLLDDAQWAIRYLIVATRNWWPGRKVLVSPRWIERVSWGDSKIYVKLDRETLKQAPEFTDETAVTRDYEASLHRHYQRPAYWTEKAAAKSQSA